MRRGGAESTVFSVSEAAAPFLLPQKNLFCVVVVVVVVGLNSCVTLEAQPERKEGG